MRIIAGQHKGRVLKTLQTQDIRPTSDKIRGAVMNMLRARGALDDAVVIDAFCGTGALGLEALSQGAAFCLFIDKSRPSLDITQENARDLKIAPQLCQFLLKDSLKIGQRPAQIPQANLIFLDPPYNQGLLLPALDALIQGDWTGKDCWITCETEKNFIPSWPQSLTPDCEKLYGQTKITLLKTA